MKPKYEIINHGWEHAQYFQGQGTASTDYEHAVTGCGDNAREAYNDAVEQVYQGHSEKEVNFLKLPRRPRGIRVRDRVPARIANQEENECWWYVSILYTI